MLHSLLSSIYNTIEEGKVLVAVLRVRSDIAFIVIELNRNMQTEMVSIKGLNQIERLDVTNQKLLLEEINKLIETNDGYASISSYKIDYNVVSNLLASMERKTTLLCSDWLIRKGEQEWFTLLTHSLGIRLIPAIGEPINKGLSFPFFGRTSFSSSVFYWNFFLTKELGVVTELTNGNVGDYCLIYEADSSEQWFGSSERNMMIFHFDTKFTQVDLKGAVIATYEDAKKFLTTYLGKSVEKYEFHSYLIRKETFDEAKDSLDLLLQNNHQVNVLNK